MNNNFGFMLTLLAGLSTVIGYFAIYLHGNRDNLISLLLSFAGGVMVIISLVDLIPSSFYYLNKYFILYRLIMILLYLVLGMFLSSLIDKHLNIDNNLCRVGFLTLFGIVLHNIPEGIVTYMVSSQNKEFGISLAFAIGLHNIPEGISIAVPLYYGTKNKIKTFLVVLVAGISEFLGALLSFLCFPKMGNNTLIGITFSITAGIMLYIGMNLFKEGMTYNLKKALWSFVLGILMMYFIILFL